ncbi:hypothetical protein [Streptomyces lushanensis]|uniref:hypothetical protein n=1 Tax=Streptomyces lushanensis TaxID=1434255 RepID=UPI00082A151B|nr:hypothetical protein [Streptomyces lushanensis]
MTRTDRDPAPTYGHSLMFLYDRALGAACESLRYYVMASQSKYASYLLNQCLLSGNVWGTDWIHRSYRDLVTIPFADLVHRKDTGEIDKRVGGQYKDYYRPNDSNAGIAQFHSYMGDFASNRSLVLGETPEEKDKELWQKACDAINDLNEQFESLNTKLDQLGSSISETLTMVHECKGDSTCLEGAITEWKTVMETAQQIDGPEK